MIVKATFSSQPNGYPDGYPNMTVGKTYTIYDGGTTVGTFLIDDSGTLNISAVNGTNFSIAGGGPHWTLVSITDVASIQIYP